MHIHMYINIFQIHYHSFKKVTYHSFLWKTYIYMFSIKKRMLCDFRFSLQVKKDGRTNCELINGVREEVTNKSGEKNANEYEKPNLKSYEYF